MTVQTATESTASSAEQNRLAARHSIDAFNARDDAAEAALRAPDFIAHAPDSIERAALGSDAWVEFLGGFLEGFPDLHLEVQDSAADGDMVAQRILFTGTNTGPFRGLPPTGRRVCFSGLEFNRMVDGRVAAGDPELILADEPVAGLDPASRVAVVDRLLDAARAGAIVILATSDPELIDRCTRVISLADG